MEFEPFRKIARFSREIVVTEKIDGTSGIIGISEPGVTPDGANKPVSIIETPAGPISIYAGSRTRWLLPMKGLDNHGFAGWVFQNAEEILHLGPGRHYGEWWGQGIQRGYAQTFKRFSLFNVSRWSGPNRGGAPECCSTVPVLYQGEFTTEAVHDALGWLSRYGSCAAPGFMRPEGVVVYHTAGNVLFKKTLDRDEIPKGAVHHATADEDSRVAA